ncbi:MAG: PAS domain S-box protein [Betaproteobacteria bacterium]|nr:MAG: PAS domain S-box protein [Betaproteobacteria bacterium]
MSSEKYEQRHVEILIAEDSATQREQLQHLLEARGYAVASAANGREALELARRHKPTLVVSDIVMPELDGYGLCRALKSDEKLKDVPVILLTSLADAHDVILGLECAADNFIRKPYQPDYLLKRIEYLLMNLELRKSQKMQMGVEIRLGSQRHFISAERQQILDLLISTYEQAAEINRELAAREKELAHSNEVLNGLNSIADGLNRAASEGEVADTALERALSLPGIQAGWISLREGESGFRLAAARNLPPALEAPGAMQDECSCRRRLLSGELGSAANILECERLAKSEGETRGLRCHATVPLWTGDRTLGVMNLVGPQEGLFSKEELKTLYGVGNQVAVALERARLHEHMERLVEDRTTALTAEMAQRKQAETALRESEAGLRRAQAMAKLAHVITGPDGSFETWSETFPELIGADAARLPRSTREVLAILEPENRALLRAKVVEAGTRKSRVEVEYRIRRADGGLVHLRQTIEPIAGPGDAQGRMRWFNTLQDVTEQRRAEDELREAELRYRSVFENVVEGIFLVNRKEEVVSGNPALARMLGYASFDEMAGHVRSVARDFYAEPGSRGRFRARLEADGVVEKFETRWRRKDGSIIWVSLSARMTTGLMRGEIHHIGVAEEITERKQAEEDRARLVAIIEATPDFVATGNLEGRTLYLNQAGRRMIGHEPGRDISEMRMGMGHPDWARKLVLETGVPYAIEHGTWSGETVFLTREGREIPVSQVIIAHKGPSGAVEYLSTIARDISELKRTEEELRQEHANLLTSQQELFEAHELLADADRLETVGRLAAGVAHEVKNPLGIIRLGADYLAQRLPQGGDQQVLDDIRVAIDRAERVIRDLLNFSRTSAFALRPTDIREVIDNAINLTRHEIQHRDITIIKSGDDWTPAISADPDRLVQVFINLLSNAAQAIGRDGTIEIATRCVCLGERDLERSRMSGFGIGERAVTLDIRDTGPGISAEHEKRLFEPFFTTKPVGEGTGLGLAVSRNIVMKHRGSISVSNRPEGGASALLTFRVDTEHLAHEKANTGNR